MMKGTNRPETAFAAEGRSGDSRRASRAAGTSDIEISGRNRRGSRSERGGNEPSEAAKTAVTDFMNSPAKPEKTSHNKSEPKAERLNPAQAQPARPDRTENQPQTQPAARPKREKPEPAASNPPQARNPEPAPAPQRNTGGSKMDQFLDLVGNGSARNELFNKHGDRSHNNGVKAPGIVSWAKDNGLDLSLSEARSIVQRIDEKANGTYHLDKVELDYFQRTGQRAPDGITKQ